MPELKLRDKQNCLKASEFLFILPIFRCKMKSNCLKNGLKFFWNFLVVRYRVCVVKINIMVVFIINKAFLS